MDKKTRRQHSPEDKVRILRLHLLEHKPVSELCDQEDIHPTLFYQWQKAFFENGAAAFDRAPRPRGLGQNERLIATLQEKLKRKDEVIAIVTEDLIRAKKENGES
jgi:transposase-like protein